MFATGHAEDEPVRQDMEVFENSSLIEKPFKLKALANAIQVLLRRA